ncbi:hypothetical protein DITRI_Ditri01bG0186100 [Diplodiscus trichospermus]
MMWRESAAKLKLYRTRKLYRTKDFSLRSSAPRENSVTSTSAAAAKRRRLYDIVIDATDNAPSRCMISDCCVVWGKPLVSGAALGLEGQLTVYNYKGGPCYRCLFPSPPPTTACQRCSDSGVLGVALEAIKIASAVGEPLSGRMLLFEALSARIRIVKIRGRSLQYEVCGENTTFNQQHFKDFDYEKFTQLPLSTEGTGLGPNLYVICRRGNDSQRAVQYLHKQGFNLAKDIVGGLESWAHDVDPNFPMY